MVLTIITICRNNPLELLRTLKSISLQNIQKFEYECLIIDGSNNCECRNVVDSFDDLKIVYIKQKSIGIYGAMNEALDLVSGVSIVFMNSGDEFYHEFSVENMLDKYQFFLDTHIVYGNAIKYYEDIEIVHAKGINDKLISDYIPSHQAVFVPSSYHGINKFDENKSVSSDTEVLIKCFKSLPNIHINEIVCRFELGGISTRPTSLYKTISHCNEIINTRGNFSLLGIVNLYFKQISKLVIIRAIGYRGYLKLVLKKQG
ncbi:TPA: glycosyltransferase [Vibrio cholerae]